MRRILFMLVVAMTFTMAGCSSSMPPVVEETSNEVNDEGSTIEENVSEDEILPADNTVDLLTDDATSSTEIDYGNLRDYMRDHFDELYPNIKAKLEALGYNEDNLECMFIWSESNIESPRLIFDNGFGVGVLKFSWKDLEWFEYNDQDYQDIYNKNDLNYSSITEAADGYVNDINIPHIYEVWSFAEPEYETELTNLGYDANNIKCRFLGETVPDGYTIMFVNQYGYVDSLIWFWDSGKVVHDDRTSDWEYEPSDCEYNSIEEAFEAFCREYW